MSDKQDSITRYIHLSHSRLTGTWWTALPRGVLRVDLSFSNLTALPKGLEFPDTLRELWLNDNPLASLAGVQWKLPELRMLEISRTEIRKVPGELAQQGSRLRIFAEGCLQLKAGHADPDFLRTKAQRHDLLNALADKLISGMYAVEDSRAVVDLVKTIGRATKGDFAIADYRRLLHSPDRFFAERLVDNSTETLRRKLAAYKAGSPHAPKVINEAAAEAPVQAEASAEEASSEEKFAVFESPVTLTNQRPLWQSLVSL